MAIGYVSDGSFHASSAAAQITYTSTAGNTLVAAGVWYDALGLVTGITSVTDSAGNPWHYSASNTQNPPAWYEDTAGQTCGTFVAWSLAAAAVTSVTLNLPSSIFTHWDLSEWTGIFAESTGGGGSGVTGDGDVASPSLGLANSGELVIAAIETINGSGPALPAGASVFPNDGGAANYLVYQIAGPSAAFSFTWTGIGGGSDFATAAAAFTGPPPPPPALYSMRSFP